MNMGKVVTGFSMSLDGFVAGLNDSAEQPLGEGGEGLFAWYASGDSEFVFPSGTFTVQISEASAKQHGWGGRHPMDVPILVVSHRPPPDWVEAEWPLTFVTDGVESAIEQARQIAGDKDVIAGSPSIAKQCLAMGLLDEVNVDLVPLLLGDGVRFFEPVGSEPIELERLSVIEAPGVTHLRFRIVK
jgi:dihydrofolate reductase